MSAEQLAPGVWRVAVRTPTVPPATHTWCYLVGESALTVFDPASPYPEEQDHLFASITELGLPVERIVLTHHHADHVGGACALQSRLGPQVNVPIWSHQATAARVSEQGIAVNQTWAGETELPCGGLSLRVMHTPGHAPGHLVFLEPTSGLCIAGDMVAGVGTVVILPQDGTLEEYLDSLERMRALGASALLPSHGPLLEPAEDALVRYITHREARTQQIRSAVADHGPCRAIDLVPVVYPELRADLAMFGMLQITTHLFALERQRDVCRRGEPTDPEWVAV